MSKPKNMTLGEFKEKLKGYPDSAEIIFGTGDLSVDRVRWRGPNLMQIEFKEVYEVIIVESPVK